VAGSAGQVVSGNGPMVNLSSKPVDVGGGAPKEKKVSKFKQRHMQQQ
jgi:hypothetical protein